MGAGGLGRELFGWIAGCGAEIRERFRVAGFVSEDAGKGDFIHGLPVLHPDEFQDERPRFVLAFADPASKKRLALQLQERGWEPEIFIHESVVRASTSKVGRGAVVSPFCTISTDAIIGEHVLVNARSGVGHDAVVGNYSSLLGAVSVNGHAVLGEGVMFGAGSMIYPGKKIGDWATVGLASVVLRNVPAHATVFGNPARRIDLGGGECLVNG